MGKVFESKKKLFQSGSIWIRADFHLHTKKDKEFRYPGEENSFINDYVSKLKEQDIRLGVVTNHDKFDMNEFKALRKKARQEDIFLLPGVELFVNDGANGIHTLVIFSEPWIAGGNDLINQFLNVTFSGRSPAVFEQENQRSNDDLKETIKKLEVYQMDFMIVFAHVENKSGLWYELGGGRIEELGKDESFKRRTLGFQKVRTIDVQNGKCKKNVQHWLGDWYPAEVEGSDNKSIEEIGKGAPCFIKIGNFSFEAVKYALLDHQNHVSKEKPQYRHSHIRSISFEGGVLDGKTIRFSPELNALIGIRGSGKSLILETLRYALDVPLGERAMDQQYKESLIAHALGSGGKVVIKAVDRHGQEFEIKRIFNEYPDVYVEGTHQPGIKIRETIIYKPIYFGQKDLTSTGQYFEKSLVEKLVAEKLVEIREKIMQQRELITGIIDRLKKLSGVDEQIKEQEGKRQDATFRLKVFENYGIAEALQEQVDFDTDSRKIKHVVKTTGNYLSEYEEFISKFEDDLNNLKIYKSKQNLPFFTEFFTIYEGIIDSIRDNKNNLVNGKKYFSQLKNKAEEFEKERKKLKDEFAEIERTISAQLKNSGASSSIRPDDFLKLRKTIDQADQRLAFLVKQQTQQKTLELELQKELKKLINLWHEEFKTIETELREINENQPALEIKSEFKGDKESFALFMKEIFKGSNIRQTTFETLSGKFVDFSQMYMDLPRVREELSKNYPVFEQYFNNNLKTLLTWQVPDRYTISYRDRELKHHSLGQRASALMLFILSQRENDVIIIDQPEDDLDNQTIYEDVIKLIRQMKIKTQFIFATHNANIPVLGDAEQVHSSRYSDEKIQLKNGSIDDANIQKEIVDIMEGGEEAFNKRKEIYKLWKPQNLSK